MSSSQHQRDDPGGVGTMPYLPLSSDDPADTVDGSVTAGQSLGHLVSDATKHLSTLVRAEVELAKSEIVGEAKKALKGALFFVIALVIALYSTFFFFFFLSELVSEWLPRWAAFGSVFLLMLVAAGMAGFLGYRKIKKVKAPQRSIESFKETAAALKSGSQNGDAPSSAGT